MPIYPCKRLANDFDMGKCMFLDYAKSIDFASFFVLVLVLTIPLMIFTVKTISGTTGVTNLCNLELQMSFTHFTCSILPKIKILLRGQFGPSTK